MVVGITPPGVPFSAAVVTATVVTEPGVVAVPWGVVVVALPTTSTH